MSSHRRRLALRKPKVDLTSFPRWRLRSSMTLYRAHGIANGPWWFASSGPADPQGRFDLPAPDGTCYLTAGAEGEVAAFRERAGVTLASLGWISGTFCDESVVSKLKLPKERRLSDALHKDAVNFGMTREISTSVRYDITCAWAGALRAVGSQGIRYSGRLSTDHQTAALAIFDASGAKAWDTDPDPKPGRQVAIEAGIDVREMPPRSSALRFSAPPSRVRTTLASRTAPR